jgi:hypothetical protein
VTICYTHTNVIAKLRHTDVIARLRHTNVIAKLRQTKIITKLRHTNVIAKLRHTNVLTAKQEGNILGQEYYLKYIFCDFEHPTTLNASIMKMSEAVAFETSIHETSGSNPYSCSCSPDR